MQNTRGFSLVEVLMAGVILSVLLLAGLASMRSSTGFMTVSGRNVEAMAIALLHAEALRNEAHPDLTRVEGQDLSTTPQIYHLTGQMDRTVDLNTVFDPTALFGVPPTSKMYDLRQMNLQVHWDEAR